MGMKQLGVLMQWPLSDKSHAPEMGIPRGITLVAFFTTGTDANATLQDGQEDIANGPAEDYCNGKQSRRPKDGRAEDSTIHEDDRELVRGHDCVVHDLDGIGKLQ